MKESVSTKAILTVINAWDANCDIAEEDSGLMEYTKEWVEKINRGGLFEVTDSFYLFVKELELIGRTILNISLMRTYKGENLKAVLLEAFNSNEK